MSMEVWSGNLRERSRMGDLGINGSEVCTK